MTRALLLMGLAAGCSTDDKTAARPSNPDSTPPDASDSGDGLSGERLTSEICAVIS